MMKKAISLFTAIILSCSPVTVLGTDAVGNDAGNYTIGLASTQPETLTSVKSQESGKTVTTTTTTTSTTSTVATTTTTFKGICDEYDFEGYLYLERLNNIQRTGEEFDFSNPIIELRICHDDGDVETTQFFSIDDFNEMYSDFYELDTSKVDMNTPGEYPVYFKTIGDKIGYFDISDKYSKELGISESNDYLVKMISKEQKVKVKVEDKPITTSTATTTTTTTTIPDTPFYFTNDVELTVYSGFDVEGVFVNKDNLKVKFTIADESIAKMVDPTAEYPAITAYKPGETTLTATSEDGTIAKMIIKVTPETTTTTTIACTETTTTTITTGHYDVRPVVEYDDSPMKIGETRIVKVYNPKTKTSSGIRSIDYNPKVVECTYTEGDDFFTMTAVAAVVYTDIWVYESSCTLSGNVGITIIDEQYVPSESVGDANCDGQLNMADAVFIMQCIANPDKYTFTEQGRKNADADKSGDITNMDALTIQKFKLRLIDSLT